MWTNYLKQYISRISELLESWSIVLHSARVYLTHYSYSILLCSECSINRRDRLGRRVSKLRFKESEQGSTGIFLSASTSSPTKVLLGFQVKIGPFFNNWYWWTSLLNRQLFNYCRQTLYYCFVTRKTCVFTEATPKLKTRFLSFD